MDKILLNREHVEALNFAALAAHRPVLSSLCVMPDRVVCTDAYRLLEVMKPKAEHATTLIDSDSMAVTRKQLNKKTLAVRFDIEGEDVNVTTANTGAEPVQTKAKTVEGRFPSYADIIPTGAPLAWVKLDAAYLRELAAYAEKFTADNNSTVFLELYGELKPAKISFTTENGNAATGLIMPLRPSDEDIEKRTKKEEPKTEPQKPVATGKVNVEDLPF